MFNFVDVGDWIIVAEFHFLLVTFYFGGFNFTFFILFN